MKSDLTKCTSTFAILDVKRGRSSLARHFRKTQMDPLSNMVPVVITGQITGVWGSDDGESQEFTVDVFKIEISK
jgi:hypothetical protein